MDFFSSIEDIGPDFFNFLSYPKLKIKPTGRPRMRPMTMSLREVPPNTITAKRVKTDNVIDP